MLDFHLIIDQLNLTKLNHCVLQKDDRNECVIL